MIRLTGAGAATTAASVAAVSAFGTDVADAAGPHKVVARLNRPSYWPGERMMLRIHTNLAPERQISITDSFGLRWTRVARHRHSQVWTAVAGAAGSGMVKVHVHWPDGRIVRNQRYRAHVGYQVMWSGISQAAAPLIGMSAPPDTWGTRVSEVGGGLMARRIFGDLAAGSSSQIKLIEQTHAAGMLPVVSYKVGGDISGAVAGNYNAVAAQAAAKLASYGKPTAVTFWHEPNNDMSTAQYVAASKQILPFFKRDQLKVGPLLNGFLLDRQVPLFTQFCPDELMQMWDWIGIDTYQLGSAASPGNSDPASRIYALSDYVKARGYDLPLGVGEYNGFTAQSIAAAGEALLTVPNVWFGCVWNSVGVRDYVLTGDRLSAFQSTLRDPRSAKPVA